MLFENPVNFLLYVSLSYAVLTGAFIGWLWQKAKNKKTMIIIALLVTILIAMLFLWNAKANNNR